MHEFIAVMSVIWVKLGEPVSIYLNLVVYQSFSSANCILYYYPHTVFTKLTQKPRKLLFGFQFLMGLGGFVSLQRDVMYGTWTGTEIKVEISFKGSEKR